MFYLHVLRDNPRSLASELFPVKGDSHCIIRDYHTEVWLLPEVSTRDPIISQRALAQELIMVEG